MAKASEDALRELDIWNGSATYADRLAAFLKLKNAERRQTYTPLALGDFDVSFDVDDALVKLPPKPLQSKLPEKQQSLTETNSAAKKQSPTENSDPKPSPAKAAAHQSPVCENAEPPSTSINLSLAHLRRSGGAAVPGSDRLRRVAIHRRSRSLGRRSLLREFNDAAASPKGINNSTANSLNFLPKTSSTPALANKSTAAAAAIASTGSLQSERSQRSSVGSVQRTYTVEMGPQPGQLLLSPSDKRENSNVQRLSQLSTQQSLFKQYSPLRQSSTKSQDILAPNTPPPLVSQSLKEPEFTVPETQPEGEQQVETVQQVLQTLASSPAATPFVVVPISCISPKPQPTPNKSTAASPRFVQNVAEIMTDDESDEHHKESSSAPLNLASSNDTTNASRQRRLRKRNPRAVKSPTLLLDLHYSRSKDVGRARNRVTRQTVLNKPSQPAINGEQFAQELARMSNYEILDLRKRNSLGMLHPINGKKEQQAMEEHIEWEIMRRNLETPSVHHAACQAPLPAASPEKETAAAPPAGFRDASLAAPNQQRRSRLRSRNASRLEQSSTASPPADFRDRSTPKQRRERRKGRPSTLSEAEHLVICTPPAQFRWSKSPEALPDHRSRHRQTVEKENMIVEEPELPEINLSKSRQKQSMKIVETELPKQLQQSRQSIAYIETVVSQLPVVEDDMVALADPPSQFQLSQQQLKAEMSAFTQPPVQFIDAVRTSVGNAEPAEAIDIEFNQQNNQISLQMEEELPAMLMETVLNELPSSSNLGQQQTQQKKHKPTPVSDDDVFKKPLAAAPRSKRAQKANKSQRELQNLRIMLANETLAADATETEDSANTTGVRKSRRGHVPLRNTWVHTQSDPFSFMRKHYEKFMQPEPKKKLLANSSELFMGRAPLSSSTPRNAVTTGSNSSGKRVRKQPNNKVTEVEHVPEQIQLSGIAQLSIVEELEAPPRSDTKKRHQKKKLKAVEPAMPAASSSVGQLEEQQPEQLEEQQPEQLEHFEPEQLEHFETEQLEPFEPEQLAETKAEPKKSGRKKKLKATEASIPPPESQPQKRDKSKETEMEPLPHSTNEQQPQIEKEAAAAAAAAPKQDNTFSLMNWLRDVEEGTASSVATGHAEVKSDSMTLSRASNLQFTNINGVDYAFYNTEDSCSVGYIRFKPLQVRGFCRAARNLQFVALYGNFKLEVNNDGSKTIGPNTMTHNLNTGDLAEIENGACYNITNCLDDVSILLTYRK